VAEPGHGPGFAIESFGKHGVGREIRGKDLDGYVSIEPQILRPEDRSHAPETQHRVDPIAIRHDVADDRHWVRRPWGTPVARPGS